jgi:flagellar motor component MotA
MRRSGLVGIGLLFLIWSSLFGINPRTFIEVRAFMIVFGSGMALGVMSYGLADFWRAVWCARALVVKVQADAVCRRDAVVLRGIIAHLYACGGVAFIVGAVLMLSQMQDPAKIGEGLAVALLAPLYAVMTSEFIVRPSARRIDETLAAAPEHAEEVTLFPAEAASADASL